MRIAFVTNPTRPEIEDDDRPLAEALARRGAIVISAAWDDTTFDWSKVDLAFLRSPWDYYKRVDEFFTWLSRVESTTRVLNPPDVVRWNANKRYMADLIGMGVHAVPTAFVARGETASIASICEARDWRTVVLKPAVSADSWETIRIEPERYGDGQAYLDRHRAERDIMIQPFVKDVEIGEEQCLVCYAGRFSHAVKKNSAFKGGRHVGPEGRAVLPESDAIGMAEEVLRQAGVANLPYARVDLARDEAGRPLLLELELFEPTLFFREAPGSEQRLAEILTA
jgi:glutathione synthase/RimK-type ligase-like ATP-grasp enzyme